MGVRAHVFPPENVLAAVAVHVRNCVQACREARKQTARRETPALAAAAARPATAERAWRGATGDEDAVLARPKRNVYDVVEKVRAAVAALERLRGEGDDEWVSGRSSESCGRRERGGGVGKMTDVGNQSGRALDMMSSWYALWLRQNEQLYILR